MGSALLMSLLGTLISAGISGGISAIQNRNTMNMQKEAEMKQNTMLNNTAISNNILSKMSEEENNQNVIDNIKNQTNYKYGGRFNAFLNKDSKISINNDGIKANKVTNSMYSDRLRGYNFIG